MTALRRSAYRLLRRAWVAKTQGDEYRHYVMAARELARLAVRVQRAQRYEQRQEAA